jgi:hypothetical protein
LDQDKRGDAAAAAVEGGGGRGIPQQKKVHFHLLLVNYGSSKAGGWLDLIVFD